MNDLLLRAMNRLLRSIDLRLVTNRSLLTSYQHDYGPGGYDEYKRIQIYHNKRKLDQVWADADTLKAIATYIQERVPVIHAGLCHGTRRGYEQAEFSRLLGCPVLGTEISDTATQFADTVQWDFHDQKPEWRGNFTFVYSNSLYHAFDPRKALSVWAEQLEPAGLMFIEQTMVDSAGQTSEMDPFGAHPMVMPHLFFKWGRGQYEMIDILELTHPEKRDIWVFVLRRSDGQRP